MDEKDYTTLIREAAESQRAYAYILKMLPGYAQHFSPEFLEQKVKDAEELLRAFPER